MIRIEKQREPKEWTCYRNTPGARYQAIPELRDSLLKEQGYICAYCMRRIPCRDANSTESTRIEHLKCRKLHPDLELDYHNMVVCCPGAITDDFHCDKRKEDAEISFDVFSENFIETLSYGSKDGTLKSSIPQWNDELNEVLHLNNELLKANRREALRAVQMFLERTPNVATVRRKLDEWIQKDCQGKYRPYCGIVIWYLQRWLRRH